MRLSDRRVKVVLFASLPSALWASSTFAQEVPTGAPPADEAAAVAAAKATTYAAPAPTPPNATRVSVAAGGQLQSGNSHLYAATAQGKLDTQHGPDAFAAGLIGNFAETRVAPAPVLHQAQLPPTWQKSTENLQGKLRYDRFLASDASVYLQVTGTHDAFQAIAFRLNLDPGFKYLFYSTAATKVWAEVGYDFQFDDNFTDANGIEQAGTGIGPSLDSGGFPYQISRNDTIHSSRIFAGFNHAFNKDVQLTAGLEYLQGFGGTGASPPSVAGFVPSTSSVCTPPMGMMIPTGTTCIDPVTISLKSARLNFDALLAANMGGGFSFGVGYSMKYNGAPLPGKENVDQAVTLNLIYAYNTAVAAAAEATPPAPATPPPPPPAAAPPPAPTPASAPEPPPAPATIPPTPPPATMTPPNPQ